MALLDLALLKRCQSLSREVRRAMGGGLFAAWRGRVPAGGTELSGHRDYAPGDDYRYIDWNLCARLDDLLTRQFTGEEDLRVYILLDCSRSMSIGSPPKFNVAQRLAATLGYLALAESASLSVAAFAGSIRADFPPARTTARALGLFRFLESIPVEATETDLALTAARFVARHQRPGPVVVIGDLIDFEGFPICLEILRRHGYEPVVVRVFDRCEAKPATLGDVELFDVESRVAMPVVITERHAERYRRVYEEFRQTVRTYCSQHRIVYVEADTETALETTVRELVKMRLRYAARPR